MKHSGHAIFAYSTIPPVIPGDTLCNNLAISNGIINQTLDCSIFPAFITGLSISNVICSNSQELCNIQPEQCENILIRDCVSYGGDVCNIQLLSCTNALVEDCVLQNTVESATAINGNSNFKAILDTGALAGGFNIRIRGCQLLFANNNVDVDSCIGFTIEDCDITNANIVDGMGGNNIVIVTGLGVNDVKILNNRLTDASYTNLFIEQSAGLTIENNSFFGPGFDGTNSLANLYVENADAFVVSNCKAYYGHNAEFVMPQFYFQTCSHFQVKNCTIVGDPISYNAGFFFIACTSGVITDNVVFDQLYGFWLAETASINMLIQNNTVQNGIYGIYDSFYDVSSPSTSYFGNLICLSEIPYTPAGLYPNLTGIPYYTSNGFADAALGPLANLSAQLF